MAARVETNRGLRERGERFESVVVHHDATVVLTGWWGRHEITSESDDDFMVVFEGSTPEGARSLSSRSLEVSAAARQGAEDIFGKPVALEDLRAKIGRDEDTKANLTRRMLFILESVRSAARTSTCEHERR
jgi:hypothetical protein